MSANFFFNNFRNSGEQSLLDSLTAEAISIYGEEMYYITRNINLLDKLYTADDQSSYTKAFLTPWYIENVDGFNGDGNFMAKFGLEIRDQVVLSISQTTFAQEIGSYTNLSRPREGDLIYFPLNNKCFQIKFVDKFEFFYQLGKVYTWKCTLELFEYSDEVFDTGIPEIDRIQFGESTNILDYSIKDETGASILDEQGNYIEMEQYNLDTITGEGTNEDIEDESNSFINFSVIDPFSEGGV